MKKTKALLLTISILILNVSVSFSEDYINVKSYVDRGIMMFSDTARGFPKAKDPAVVKFKGKYFLYYTVKQNKEITGLRIGIATSDDMITWKKWESLRPNTTMRKKELVLQEPSF